MTEGKPFEERVSEVMIQIMGERLAKAERRLPARDYVSELAYAYYPNLTQWRRRLTVASTLLTVASIAEHLVSLPARGLASTAAVATGTALLVVVFLEVVLGAGSARQREYHERGQFGREFSFEVSIPELRHLMAPLGAGLVAFIVGFSAIHLILSERDPSNYSRQLDALTSIYFSLVTFTSGIGDISPASKGAIVLVSIQILLSWLVLAVILAVTISWVLEHQRSRVEKRSIEDEIQMQAFEQLLKEAKSGVYADTKQLRKEAERRVRAQEQESTRRP